MLIIIANLEVAVINPIYPNIDRYAQKNRQDEELENMGVDPSPVSFGEAQTYEQFINQNPAQGMLKIQAFTARQALPVPGAHITVSKNIGGSAHVFYEGITDESGIIDGIVLPAPARSSSEKPFQPHPFALYDIYAVHPSYHQETLHYGAIFEGVKSIQPIDLIPTEQNA